jgi:hypothetical protein
MKRGSMIRKIVYFIPLFVFYGCTTQNFVPPRPLNKGENELRVSFNFSLNNFSWYSVQFSAFHGITENDVIGTSFTNFPIPNQVSYAHYWQNKNTSQNIQIHLNDLIASNFNPSLELDLGFSNYSGNAYNSFKIGIGYYDTPLLLRLVGNSIAKHKVVPIFGYRFQHKLFSADLQMIRGMTGYFIRYYKADYRKYAHRDEVESQRADNNYIFSNSKIDTIIRTGNQYQIVMQSNDTLLIAERNPYTDCIGCGIEKDFHSAYPASEHHRVYWIYWKDHWEKEDRPLMLELNMKKILEDFEKGMPLQLTEEQNLSEETLKRHNLFFQDFFFSVGRVEYQK